MAFEIEISRYHSPRSFTLTQYSPQRDEGNYQMGTPLPRRNKPLSHN